MQTEEDVGDKKWNFSIYDIGWIENNIGVMKHGIELNVLVETGMEDMEISKSLDDVPVNQPVNGPQNAELESSQVLTENRDEVVEVEEKNEGVHLNISSVISGEDRKTRKQEFRVANYQIDDAVELFDHFKTVGEFFSGPDTFWNKTEDKRRHMDGTAAAGGGTYRCSKYQNALKCPHRLKLRMIWKKR